jgi:hypothetical protein
LDALEAGVVDGEHRRPLPDESPDLELFVGEVLLGSVRTASSFAIAAAPTGHPADDDDVVFRLGTSPNHL